jgi:hypothetical protein
LLDSQPNNIEINNVALSITHEPAIVVNMSKDRFHDVVRTALEKEGWQITADPYEINVDDVDFEIDLAAAQAIARYQLQLIVYDVQEEVIVQWL